MRVIIQCTFHLPMLIFLQPIGKIKAHKYSGLWIQRKCICGSFQVSQRATVRKNERARPVITLELRYICLCYFTYTVSRIESSLPLSLTYAYEKKMFRYKIVEFKCRRMKINFILISNPRTNEYENHFEFNPFLFEQS